MNEYSLDGCEPTPISNYCKSLGIFKILSKKHPKTRAFWKNNKFILMTDLDREEILEFILNDYVPTPILAPWSYSKYDKAVKALANTYNSRFSIYKNEFERTDGTIPAYDKTNQILKNFFELNNLNIDEITVAECKKLLGNKKNKKTFFNFCRNNLSDETVHWLDTVFVSDNKTDNDKVNYGPIVGTGGNDGNYDISQNFVLCLINLFSDKDYDKSKRWLELSLFNTLTSLEGSKKILQNIPGHNPDNNASYVSGWGYDNESQVNPWDYILMIEGVMLFAGSLSRRQSKNSKNKAAFPFTTENSSAGYATASDEDNRGEIWLPIWNNPAVYDEIEYVFNEGRAQLGGKQATTGTEFARAAVGLGTERGISAFQRTCILKRKGDAFLYVDGGQINTHVEPRVDLLNDLDVWYQNIEKKSKSDSASATLKRLTRNFDEAVLKFCRYKKSTNLIEILAIVGRLERYISSYETDLLPLELKSSWFEFCYDNTSEFRLAAAVASIGSKNGTSIRENLEPIHYDKKWKFTKDFTSYVWKEEDNLLNNLSRVLYRRALDGKINSCDSLPIKGSIYAKISDIVKFLNGELDMKKIADLILPLSIILEDYKKYPPWYNDPKINYMPLPEVYSILKLIHPPSDNENIPFDNSIISLLDAQKLSQAYLNASNILATHGLPPKTYQKNLVMPEQVNFSKSLEKHIMASLLFPISPQDRSEILSDTVNKPKI